MPYLPQSAGCNYQTFGAAEDPELFPEHGKLYGKFADNVIQLFWQDSEGTIHQITPAAEPPPSSGEIFDYVLDPTAVAEGNVYTDFASLYAEASTKVGAHRVFCNSLGGGSVQIDAEFALSGDWHFIGYGGEQNTGRRKLEFISDGLLHMSGANLRFENLHVVAQQSSGRFAIELGEELQQDCMLVFDKCIVEYGQDTGLVTRDPDAASNFNSRIYFTNCLDYGGGPGFCLSGLDFSFVYLQFTDIQSPNFFGPGAVAQESQTTVYIDQCVFPTFPPGVDGTGESPFNGGADSGQYYFRRIARAQTAIVEFAENLEDVSLYALASLDILGLRATEPGLEVRTLSFDGSASMLAFDVVNTGSESYLIRHAFGEASGDFWCPNGEDVRLDEYDGVRIVRDTVNNVWRVLAYANESQSIDLVYNTTVDPSGNVFDTFVSLHAVGNVLSGVKRVYLETDLDLSDASEFDLNGGWSFEGIGSFNGVSDSANLQGYRRLALTSGILRNKGNTLKFRRLQIEGNGGNIELSHVITGANLGGINDIVLDQCTCMANASHVFTPDPDATEQISASMELIDSVVNASGGFGLYNLGQGVVNVRNSDISSPDCFPNAVNLSIQFESGLLPLFDMATGPWGSNIIVYSNQQLVTQTYLFDAQVDDLNPSGLTVMDVLLLNSNDVLAPGVSGIVRPTVSGPCKAAFDVVSVGNFATSLLHDDIGSEAGNRFLCPGNVPFPLPSGTGCRVVYDVIALAWRVIG